MGTVPFKYDWPQYLKQKAPWWFAFRHEICWRMILFPKYTGSVKAPTSFPVTEHFPLSAPRVKKCWETNTQKFPKWSFFDSDYDLCHHKYYQGHIQIDGSCRNAWCKCRASSTLHDEVQLQETSSRSPPGFIFAGFTVHVSNSVTNEQTNKRASRKPQYF